MIYIYMYSVSQIVCRIEFAFMRHNPSEEGKYLYESLHQAIITIKPIYDRTHQESAHVDFKNV